MWRGVHGREVHRTRRSLKDPQQRRGSSNGWAELHKHAAQGCKRLRLRNMLATHSLPLEGLLRLPSKGAGMRSLDLETYTGKPAPRVLIAQVVGTEPLNMKGLTMSDDGAPFDEGMATHADLLDNFSEQFYHICVLWMFDEDTKRMNGINGTYTDTVESFQQFVRDYVENAATCERAGGGSFRDHQTAKKQRRNQT